MLLTDEEIGNSWPSVMSWIAGERDRKVAKAQLKKVVDYLDTLEFHDDWGGESGKVVRDTIRQALLDEVKD